MEECRGKSAWYQHNIQSTGLLSVVRRAVEKDTAMSEVERTDNSQWMASLPEKVRREVPLMDLAIPGSHDSFTSNLTRWVLLLTGDSSH